MPPITAILQTLNDGFQLGRALESLRPCDEMLIVDHGSTDNTLCIAREYGSRIQSATPEQPLSRYLPFARHDWILCVLPSEALTEGLEASLFEWKLCGPGEVTQVPSCAVVVRAEGRAHKTETETSTRLVPKIWDAWDGPLPRHDPRSLLLQGELLRFRSSLR
jgi:hypothetical protein